MRKGLIGGFVVALLALAATGAAEASLLAPPSECGGQRDRLAKERAQEQAMRCLIDYARDRAGVGSVRPRHSLARAAGRKATDIDRCGFSHTACGRPFDYWPRRTGYAGQQPWLLGENLAWGGGARGSARRVMASWLGSPPHRRVLLMPRFEHLGLGLRTRRGTAFWTLELGCHDCR